MTECTMELVGLALLSLALLISLCLNVIFFIRQRAILCRDTNTDECCNISGRDSLSQEEGHYFHNLNQNEQQENPHNHHEQQENPIYGNISTERRGSEEVCYEMMTMQHTRDRTKSSEPDVNYASLDLKVANKYKKKHRHQHGHAQGRNKLQDQLPVQLPVNALLEVEADMDVQLPPRDTSTTVSHSSIYLNSQQIAQETEDRERERGINMMRENVGWEGMRWKGEQEGEERKDYSNGSVCIQLSEVEAIHRDTDDLSSSFRHDSVHQE